MSWNAAEGAWGSDIRTSRQASAAELRAWRNQIRRTGTVAQGVLNEKQREVVCRVIHQAEKDIAEAESDGPGNNSQFIWMLHGGPGTGKSHVIDAIRRDLFEDKLGWAHGLDFQVAALQATNAGQLHGHTLTRRLV